MFKKLSLIIPLPILAFLYDKKREIGLIKFSENFYCGDSLFADIPLAKEAEKMLISENCLKLIHKSGISKYFGNANKIDVDCSIFVQLLKHYDNGTNFNNSVSFYCGDSKKIYDNKMIHYMKFEDYWIHSSIQSTDCLAKGFWMYKISHWYDFRNNVSDDTKFISILPSGPHIATFAEWKEIMVNSVNLWANKDDSNYKDLKDYINEHSINTEMIIIEKN